MEQISNPKEEASKATNTNSIISAKRRAGALKPPSYE